MRRIILPARVLVRWQAALMGALALLLLRGPALLSRAMGNVGMSALRGALVFEAARPDAPLQIGDYPLYHVLPEREARPAVAMLRRALALDNASPTARWGLGRAALVTGDAATAAEVLQPLTGRVKRNPLLYCDALTAFSYGGKPAEVISLYEGHPPPERTRAVSDTVALAYLEESRGAEEQGSRGAGEQEGRRALALERARELRPGDLYANYFLWKQAQEAGDVEAAAAYSETLIYFPLEAIQPTDERLLDYVAEVIPNLLGDGLWDREKTLNVISFLMWQHNEAAGVERLLERLSERCPTEPDWPFYLAELYHRRGDLEQAEAAYRQVLTVDPVYAQAYLRLGMVSEARSNESASQRVSEAAKWYEQYHALAPDDLLGLKRLAEVCATLEEAGVEDESCREATERVIRNSPFAIRNLQEELEAKTDDRRIVAELLDVPVEDVELGPNLVENGGFEEWQENKRPEKWSTSNMSNYPPFGKALFVTSADNMLRWEGQLGVRIVGLWQERQPGESRPRAGFWAWNEQQGTFREIPVQGGEYYVISLMYQASDDDLAIWVANDEALLFANDLFLPATHGEVYRYTGVFESRANGFIRPLIRYWGKNNAWFDDVSVRPALIDKDVLE